MSGSDTSPPNSSQTPSPVPAGLMVIDKPVGPTSMAVCSIIRARVRRGMREAGLHPPKRLKVGHGGTLDPLASGVLVVMVGGATKLCERVMAGAKQYEADVDLAHTSESDDLEREPVAVEASPLDERQVRAALPAFTGTIQQSPPAHSAMKLGGKRAYELARAGTAPEMARRPVRIDALELLSYDWPIATLRIDCGKGVYVRSLARDLGRSLGVGGMLAGLRRTRVGQFRIEQSIALDDLPDAITKPDLLDPACFDQDLLDQS